MGLMILSRIRSSSAANERERRNFLLVGEDGIMAEGLHRLSNQRRLM